ncbi:MAG: TetR family transcriptional regulator, partial [Deltaproteobacteria bacterium]|nr:TetR family transcriptional regulator [Deltaproteobacteria bacterium]
MPRRGKSRAEASQETRDALIEAGMAAFASEGLDAPSLDSICERAGYTRGAFYVHFKDRN